MSSQELLELVDNDDLDRLFDILTLEEIADAWWRYQLGERHEDDPDWWAVQLWHGTPIYDMKERARELIRALAERAPAGADLGLLGAGPVENCTAADEDTLRWIETEAQRSENFRKALGHVWRWDLPHEAFLRIEAAAGSELPWPEHGHGERPTRP